jgi:hypothetical protein
MRDKEKENRKIALFIAFAYALIGLMINPEFSLLSIIIIFIAIKSFEKLEKNCQKENSP